MKRFKLSILPTKNKKKEDRPTKNRSQDRISGEQKSRKKIGKVLFFRGRKNPEMPPRAKKQEEAKPSEIENSIIDNDSPKTKSSPKMIFTALGVVLIFVVFLIVYTKNKTTAYEPPSIPPTAQTSNESPPPLPDENGGVNQNTAVQPLPLPQQSFMEQNKGDQEDARNNPAPPAGSASTPSESAKKTTSETTNSTFPQENNRIAQPREVFGLPPSQKSATKNGNFSEKDKSSSSTPVPPPPSFKLSPLPLPPTSEGAGGSMPKEGTPPLVEMVKCLGVSLGARGSAVVAYQGVSYTLEVGEEFGKGKLKLSGVSARGCEITVGNKKVFVELEGQE